MSADNWQRKLGGFSFSKSKKEPDYRKGVPGPGEYEWRESQKGGLITSKSPKTHIDKYRLGLPGPGYYDYNTDKGHMPSYTMKGRSPDKYSKVPVSCTQGPGSYEADMPNRMGNTVISKASRMMMEKNTLPGPGSYEIPTTIATASRRK